MNLLCKYNSTVGRFVKTDLQFCHSFLQDGALRRRSRVLSCQVTVEAGDTASRVSINNIHVLCIRLQTG